MVHCGRVFCGDQTFRVDDRLCLIRLGSAAQITSQYPKEREYQMQRVCGDLNVPDELLMHQQRPRDPETLLVRVATSRRSGSVITESRGQGTECIAVKSLKKKYMGVERA